MGLAHRGIVGDEQTDFLEFRTGVDKTRDALARRQFAGAMLLLNALRPAAFAQLVF